jgi:large conductance mechanosensitive channel
LVAINYGQFIQDFISFIVIAFVIFIVIKKVLAAFDKKEEEEKEDPAPTEVDILTEIRDQLKKQNG